MLTEQQQKEFSSLKVEVIDLNILAHTFVRKINRQAFLWQKTTRHHIFEELTALRYMENGLILHLTNLDDDNSQYSFRGVAKEIRKTRNDQKAIEKLNNKLKEYRFEVNSLKNKLRNRRIAHLNYTAIDDMDLGQFLNFETVIYPSIKTANNLGDLIWGEKINYGFDLGKYAGEGILDFRSLTENLKINLHAEKGF